MPNQSQGEVDRIYGSANLTERIFAALERSGLDISQLNREALSAFDEFHAGGIGATRQMAGLAELARGARVLDIGSGVGGPARTLAAEWGCMVTGIDVTASFCDLARELNTRVGLDDRITIECADAITMPFETACFDVAWAQYSLPSIPRQDELFAQIARVLKPGGVFVFETLCAGLGGEIHVPVFWADTRAANHIRDPKTTRASLENVGFTQISFENLTSEVLQSARLRLEQAKGKNESDELWLGLIVPDRPIEKMQNSILNSEQDRTRVMRGIFRRAS
ncbi:MAG: methyltransferase domain-containing protein [Pseudomonadota bacterium]